MLSLQRKVWSAAQWRICQEPRASPPQNHSYYCLKHWIDLLQAGALTQPLESHPFWNMSDFIYFQPQSQDLIIPFPAKINKLATVRCLFPIRLLINERLNLRTGVPESESFTGLFSELNFSMQLIHEKQYLLLWSTSTLWLVLVIDGSKTCCFAKLCIAAKLGADFSHGQKVFICCCQLVFNKCHLHNAIWCFQWWGLLQGDRLWLVDQDRFY